MISTINMKIRLPMALPKKITLRSTGVSNNPSIQPRSCSTAIERLSPKVPAKINVTQSTPDVTVARVRASNSNEKLKIKMTSKAKAPMAEISSRLRNSADKSFQTMALTALKYEGGLMVTRSPIRLSSDMDGLRHMNGFFINSMLVKDQQLIFGNF